MIEIGMKHVNAICHAEFLVNGMMHNAPIPMMRGQLEDDLLRLAELKLHIIKSNIQPDLPFEGKPQSDGDTDKP